MKMPRFLCFGVILIALVFYFPLHSVLLGEAIDMHTMDKIAIDAVNEAYGWADKEDLRSRLSDKNYFNNTLLYRVLIDNMTHPPIFIVAIDKMKMNADVFLSYREVKTNKFICEEYLKRIDKKKYEQYLKKYENKNLELSSKEFLEKDIAKFSNIIFKESLIIKKTNIKDYIESFLYLVSFGSSLKESIDDIYLPEVIKSKVKKYIPNVSPLKYDLKRDTINIEFYSYNPSGFLLIKWSLLVSQNGEVISFNAEEFVIMDIAVKRDKIGN